LLVAVGCDFVLLRRGWWSAFWVVDGIDGEVTWFGLTSRIESWCGVTVWWSRCVDRVVVDGIGKWWVLLESGTGWFGYVVGVCSSNARRFSFSSALTWEKDDVGSVCCLLVK
jgi:hypothetical protein